MRRSIAAFPLHARRLASRVSRGGRHCPHSIKETKARKGEGPVQGHELEAGQEKASGLCGGTAGEAILGADTPVISDVPHAHVSKSLLKSDARTGSLGWDFLFPVALLIQ